MSDHVDDFLTHVNELLEEVDDEPGAPGGQRSRFAAGPGGIADLAPPQAGESPAPRWIRRPRQIQDLGAPPPTAPRPDMPPMPSVPPPTAPPAPPTAPPEPSPTAAAPGTPATPPPAPPQDDPVEKTGEPRPRWRDRMVLRRPDAPAPGPVHRSAAEWFTDLTTRRNSILLNATAAATGAWGYGAFTLEWETGLPQTFLAWMHNAHAHSTVAGPTPVTALALGGLITLGVVIGSGIAYAFLSRLFNGQATLCTVAHWLVVRVPVTSALTALALFQAP